MIDPRWQGVRRLLVIRLDNLGDLLVTTPAIHAIKSMLPDVKITLLASPVGAQVGRMNPDLAGVIVYEAPWVDPWQEIPHDSAREQEMIERIRAEHFDAAVIFTSFRQSSLPAAYLCYLADIPLRLAASVDGPGSLLTDRHKHPETLMHEVERGLDLVAAIGIPAADPHLVLKVDDDARGRACQWRGEWTGSVERDPNRPLIVVHPGCSMPARTYPADQYVDAVEALVSELNAVVLLTGADSERALVASIAQKVTSGVRPFVHDLAGTLAFPDLCAVITEADLVLTNNTGPMHIAAATGTPVIALFALTNPPEQWGPWLVPHRILNHDVPCRLCYSRVCPFDQECLRTVTAAEIVSAANALGVGFLAFTQGEVVPALPVAAQ